MNPDTTYDAWHPHELETIPAAIDRVLAELAATQAERDHAAANTAAPDRNDLYEQSGAPGGKYAVAEWYHGHRIITGDELATYERRNRERLGALTDEPIGRGAPTTLTVIRGGKG